MEENEKLKAIYENFAASLKKLAEEAIGGMISEFLPFAENDLQMKVFMYSQHIITDFLTDGNTYKWMNAQDIFNELNSKEVRAKMLKEYENVLVDGIIKDQIKEIQSLNERVAHLEESLEYYRRVTDLM